MYLQVQKGGSIPVFHGVRRRGGGFSFKIFKPFTKVIGKSLLKVGKICDKKSSTRHPGHCAKAGTDILHRKKPLKSVAKGALSHASRSLMKNTRESIEQELANHGKKRWWTHVEEESEDGGEQKKEAFALNFKTLLRPV